MKRTILSKIALILLAAASVTGQNRSQPGTASLQESSRILLSGVWNYQPTGSFKGIIDVPGFIVWQRAVDDDYNFSEPVERPGVFLEGKPEGTYSRTLEIPSSMEGKRIFLRFESVNFIAVVYINDQEVGSHIGGFIPFEIDITPYVDIPSTNTLEVKLRYWDSRFLDYLDRPLWPVGFFGNYWNLGITDDVYLIARSPVYIDDVFVETPVRYDHIYSTLTLVNRDTISRSVEIAATVYDEGFPVKSLGSRTVHLESQEEQSVVLDQSWSDPVLWWPEQPHLYHLVCTLSVNGEEWDSIVTPFGFREIRIRYNQFYLNGIRYNLRGDNIVLFAEKSGWHLMVPDPSNWSTILDSLKALNINVIRIHQEPPPSWVLDLCDEKGMLVIAESAIFSRPNVPKHSAAFLDNAVSWTRDWVKRDRNHPSIVVWCAENEMILWGNRYTEEELARLGQAIHDHDGSRPVLYEGDNDLEGRAEIYSYHYIFGYPTGYPSGSIYNIGDFTISSKPTSFGEFDWRSSSVSEPYRIRRHCFKVRAGRYRDFADIRPYRLDWAWHPIPAYFDDVYDGWTPTEEEIALLRASLNPIAVFDKGYYEYDEIPSTPAYDEGQTLYRTVILFNDDYTGETVEVQWRVLLDGQVQESGSFTETLALGSHKEKSVVFHAPYVPEDSPFLFELSSWKSGQQRFRETYRFISRYLGSSAPSPVTDLQISRNGGQATLSWTPVTTNTEGEPITVDHYILWRSHNAAFLPEETTVIQPITETGYVDDISEWVGRPESPVFYTVRVQDSEGRNSSRSNIVGKMDYLLTTTPQTSVNEIGIPIHLPGIEQAEDLVNLIPAVETAGRWDVYGQGYEQYIPGITSTNFDIVPGNAYYVHALRETTLTFVGQVADPPYSLETTYTTSFNHILVPPDKGHIVSASSLMQDIPDCDGIARWNAQEQGYEQFIPGIEETDFSVGAGSPCYAHVSRQGLWPGGAGPLSVTKPALSLSVSRVPHAAGGRIDLMGGTLSHFIATIPGRPHEALTPGSPGCRLTSGYWMVQCASFPTPWTPGDTLEIRFFDPAGYERSTVRLILSSRPVDEMTLTLSGPETEPPAEYGLESNFPNPFNASTALRFSMPVAGAARLDILDSRGRLVRRLLNANMEAGFHSVIWDGTGDEGMSIPSGVYFALFRAGPFTKSVKMTLLR
jgi:hypothetical protein